MLTSYSDLNANIFNAIDFLEKQYSSPQGTHARYNLDAFEHMAMHTVHVEGKDIVFLVDSGAGNSVIKVDEFEEK